MTAAIATAKPKDYGIDAFRWICILSVLVHHSVFPTRQSQETMGAIFVAKELLSWCVTGFFFVSGWLSNPDSLSLGSTWTRAKRLLAPYLGVNLVLALIMFPLLQTGWFVPNGAESWTVQNFLWRMAFLQGMGPQFYFLPYLLIVGTISLLSARSFGRTGGVVFWAAASTLLYALNGIPSTPFGSELDRIPLYCTIFSLGMALRTPHRNRWNIAIAAGGLLCSILLVRFGMGTTALHTFLPIPIFFGVRMLATKINLAWIDHWNSGALYLWHAPLINPVSSLLWHRAGLPGGLELLLTMATTVVLCQFVHRLASRTPWGRFLTL